MNRPTESLSLSVHNSYYNIHYMKTIDKSKPVLVTGGNGYVAGWIIKKLVDEGFIVHAAVRDPENSEKLKYLEALAAKGSGTIRYFRADLLEPGSYTEAMKGCELVYHTASPFYLQVKDPQKDLIDPALSGTRNVLASVDQTLSIKRVVLTSSCAAIIGDSRDTLSLPGGIATEKDWNTTSSLTNQPYNYSKTLAEREAWNICGRQERWDLVVINPSFVLGPGIAPTSTSESFRLIKQLTDGTMKTGVPRYEIAVVDVREVAEAHYRAGFTPDAEGRYLLSAGTRSFLQLAHALRQSFGPGYPLPSRELPKFLVWLMAPAAGLSRRMVSRNMGYPYRVDSSKSEEKLGISYRSPEESIVDHFRQMVEHGIVSSR